MESSVEKLVGRAKMCYKTSSKAISPLVSAILLTMIVIAGFATLYAMWQRYASSVFESEQHEIVKMQKELSWFADIEYGYLLNTLDACILHIWYYCTPLNCSLESIYLNGEQVSVKHSKPSSIINNLYLYSLTLNLTALENLSCPSQPTASIKLIIAFGSPGSPYYIVKEVTYLIPVINTQ